MTRQVLTRLSLCLIFAAIFSCAYAEQVGSPSPTEQMAPPPSGEAAAPSSSSDMSLNQFQQWLQTNGNAQGAVNPTSQEVPPPIPSANHAGRHEMTFEENQQAMLHAAPPSPLKPTEDSETAFNAMLQQNMPLQPQQVVRLHQQIDISQRAAAMPANIPPKPVSTTLMINLAPGTTPPAIRLAQGYVSSLVFVDSTGSPWPIASYDIGNPRSVNIQWDSKGNILLLQAVTPYSYGDIVIRLAGLPTPITLELVSGQRVVDYRVDLHVSGIGPNTKELPVGMTLPGNANQLLLGVLDGVAPAGSRSLQVHGADAQAWVLGDKMYFRTRLTLLSPGWIGTMVSPDGMHAYELPKTSSVLVSRYGEPTELKIEGF
ncbi:MAG: type IV secretion protein IcmK [Gammaproteobacteria bacterium]|nr:type IV secretion protein IcmK [Gammaproteobacteria bacterium]